MPNYVIQVVINAAGVGPVINNISNQINQVSQAANNAANNLKKPTTAVNALHRQLMGLTNIARGGLAALGVGTLTSEIIQLSDAYTVLQNKLRTVTDGQDELDKKTEQTFKLAQRLRTEWGATAGTYAKIRRTTEDLGLSEDQVMKITENLTKTIKTSGSTANETRSVLLQMGQAFSSGKLAGDEFRSAMENASEIGTVLASSLGVTRGELKALSKEGRITSDVMARAFLTPHKVFAQFSEAVPTFSERLTVLKNAATKAIGEFAKGSLLFKVLGGLIGTMADNIDIVVRAMTGLSVVLAVVLAAKAIPMAIAAFNALTAAMLANPAVALATGLAVLAAVIGDLAVKEMADDMSIAEKQMNALEKQVTDAKRSIGSIEEAFRRSGREAAAAAGYAAGFFETIEKKLQNLRTVEIGFHSIQKMMWETTPHLIEAVTQSTIKNVDRLIKKQEEARRAYEKVVSEYQRAAGQADPAMRASLELMEVTQALTKAIKAGLTTTEEAAKIWQDYYDRLFDAASVTRELAEVITADLGPGDGLAEQVTVQNQAFATQGEVLARTAIERENLLLNLEKQAIAQREVEAAFARMPLMYQAHANAINQVNKSYREGAIGVQDYRDAIKDADLALLSATKGSRSLEYGIANGMEQLRRQATDVAGAMETAFSNAYAGIENAIVDLVVTGKTSFKSLVDGMLADLTRVLTRLAFTKLLQGDYTGAAIAGGAVGAGGLISSLGAMRTGGSFTVPGSGGPDSRVVAFRASPKEQVTVTTPNQTAQGNFPNAAAPIIKVINVYSERETSSIDTPAGGRAFTNLIRKNPMIVRSRNR